MTKLTLLGAAVFIAASATAMPAFAGQHRSWHAANIYAQKSLCAVHDPGNPYSEHEDYLGWSAWRSRGSWDDRVDPACGYGIIQYPSSGL